MPERKLPLIAPETEAFWTGGKDGALMIQRCTTCGTYQHPPLPICSHCRTETVLPQAVSGRGKVRSWTVNHQEWVPGLDEPFYYAVVELEEQGELYVFCNILAPIGSVTTGMPVKVCFEHHEDVWLPQFEPVLAPAGEKAHG
ncbi:MAG: Zn-ribbon domain-containing OB-fold protein [Novosphingobium sp.]